MQFANNQAKFTLWRHGVRDQAGRGQVPRLQPRHPAQPPATASRWAAPPLLASLQRTAIMTSDKFKGVRLTIRARHAARGVRTTPSRKRPMDELDIDYGGDSYRDRLQRDLPDGRAGQHVARTWSRSTWHDGNSSALITIPEQRQLQVRRHAHAHLTSTRRLSAACCLPIQNELLALC